MRDHMNLVSKLFEAKKVTDKDKVRTGDIFGPPKTDQPIATVDKTTKSDLTDPTKIPGKVSSKGPSSINMPITPDAAQHLSDLSANGMEDEIDDDEAARRAGYDPSDVDTTVGFDPPNPENLPALVSKEIAELGDSNFDPEWFQVKRLPGYLQSPIRALGRSIFGQFTDTPIEDIQVMATVVNPEIDVKKMMAFIRKNGIRDDDAHIDFGQIMPGYHADVQLWRMVGCEFLLVKDMMGYYIYSWPGGRGVHLSQTDTKQLREGYINLLKISKIERPLRDDINQITKLFQ